MKVRHGRYGAFLGCTRFPECKGIINIPKKGEQALSQENLPPCPAIDCPGTMVARKSRFGKIFYSCSTFPECDVIVNNLEQIPTKYPDHPRTPFQKKEKKGSKCQLNRRRQKQKQLKQKRPKPKRQKPPKLKQHVSCRVTSYRHYSLSHLDTPKLYRGEVTKKVWDYIKAHQLQDSAK